MIRRSMDIYRRWESIGYRAGSRLYAVELSNGLVKVGYTHNPQTRLSCLTTSVRREFGSEILRYHLSDRIDRDVVQGAEREMLSLMRKVAAPIQTRAEYFDAISFEFAVSAINKTAAKARTPIRTAAPEPETARPATTTEGA